MKILGYVYRFVSNFAFLALVYYSLNFMEKYQQRAIVAILVLVYALDARDLGAAFVLLLPEDRAARTRGAPSRRLPGRGPGGVMPHASKSSPRWRRCATTAR